MAAKKSDFCFLKTNNTQLKLLRKDHELYLNLFSFSEHARFLRARAREWVSSLLTSFFAQNVNKVDCVSLKKSCVKLIAVLIILEKTNKNPMLKIGFFDILNPE